MTELQIGLVGLGVVAVFCVVVYNTWQEYRHRKLVQKLLDEPQEDALMAGANSVRPPAATEGANVSEGVNAPAPEVTAPQVADDDDIPVLPLPAALSPDDRIEPVLHSLSATASAPEAEPEPEPALPPPVVQETAQPPSPEKPANEQRNIPEPLHLLSPAMDYIAAFETVKPASASQIILPRKEVFSRIRKPLHLFGFNAMTREWEKLVVDNPDGYCSFRIGLQQVDRRGPVVENDLALFHLAMNDLAEELMAIVNMPQRQAALDAAAELDAFCAGVDIQIGINLICGGTPFPGTKIRSLAEAAGMVVDAEGRYVRCNDEGHVLYLLLNQEDSGFFAETMKTMSTRGLTFLLDAPRVAHGERVFDQMIGDAQRFAETLRGTLVDDNRRPLSSASLDPIRRQIAQYQATMASRQFPAGGVMALRLFS